MPVNQTVGENNAPGNVADAMAKIDAKFGALNDKIGRISWGIVDDILGTDMTQLDRVKADVATIGEGIDTWKSYAGALRNLDDAASWQKWFDWGDYYQAKLDAMLAVPDSTSLADAIRNVAKAPLKMLDDATSMWEQLKSFSQYLPYALVGVAIIAGLFAIGYAANGIKGLKG